MTKKRAGTRRFDTQDSTLYTAFFSASDVRVNVHGQVAQLVERGPEKAGVGGSIPSLAIK
jgi:hypothetical protein